jgi:hypothetical protein
MNKYLFTLIISLVLCFSGKSFAQQTDDQTREINPEEETIGGIGGTGIRSMSRPELLERPERIERPEILESREALEDSLGIDSPLDTGADELEKPEQIQD